MVQRLARALEFDNAFIAECLDEPATRVRTLACWSAPKGLVENVEFRLPGGPPGHGGVTFRT